MLVRSLRSGSSGNALLVRSDSGSGIAVLIDAGGPYRSLYSAIRSHGVEKGQLAAVLLTHDHSDHVYSAGRIAAEYDAPVVANKATLEKVGLAHSGVVLQTGGEKGFGSIIVRSFPAPHDGVETVGYRAEVDGYSVAVATDLGEVTPDILDAMQNSDVVVLEANHDPKLLWRGPYPQFLKRRIAGPLGHLSNLQAAKAATVICGERTRCLWLAHLSEANNDPAIAAGVVCNSLVEAKKDWIDVQVLDRFDCGPIFGDRYSRQTQKESQHRPIFAQGIKAAQPLATRARPDATSGDNAEQSEPAVVQGETSLLQAERLVSTDAPFPIKRETNHRGQASRREVKAVDSSQSRRRPCENRQPYQGSAVADGDPDLGKPPKQSAKGFAETQSIQTGSTRLHRENGPVIVEGIRGRQALVRIKHTEVRFYVPLSSLK